MAVLAQDTFGSHATGAGLPTGYTSRWAAIGTASIVEDVATIGGKYLRQTAASGARRFLSFDAVPSTTTDCEVLTLVRVGSYLTGSSAALTAISVVLRGGGTSGGENGYKIELNKVAGSGLSSELRFRISKYVSSTDSEIAAVPYVWANNTWYWIRARVDGTVLRASIWALGDTPPASWTIGDAGTVTDASLSAGYVGFKSFDASRTHDVQYVGVSTDGTTVPVPGASATVQVVATLAGGGAVSAGVTVRKPIVATLATGSSMAVVFSGRVDLAATMRGGGSVAAVVTVRKQIAALITSGTTIAATVAVRRRLVATLSQGSRLHVAFLTPTTIALSVGGIPLLVVGDGASESAPEIVGERGRALSGRDAGRVRAEFRVRRFTLYEMSPAEWAALKTATPPGAIVTCGGTLLGGDGWYTVTREAAHDWHGSRAVGSQHTLVVTLTLTEAGA